LKQTLDTYDATPQFLREAAHEMSPSTLSNSIIGMIGDMDAPLSPDQKGFTSLERHLTGLSDEMRQMRREQVLSTTAKNFRDFGERLEAVSREGTIAVVGSDAALSSVKDALSLKIQQIM